MRSQGWVTATAAGGKITVLRPGRAEPEVLLVDRNAAATAVVGDWVLIDDDGLRPIVVGVLGTGAGPSTPDGGLLPPEATTPASGSDVMPPTWSGTWRGSGWRSSFNDLVQGDGGWGLSQGAAFYGSRPASLGVTFGSGSVHLVRETFGIYGSGTPTMRLLGATAPGGAYPSILATAAGPSLPNVGSAADWPLPSSWLVELASGAAGGIGIGVPGSTPYMRIDGPSMRLTLNWWTENPYAELA